MKILEFEISKQSLPTQANRWSVKLLINNTNYEKHHFPALFGAASVNNRINWLLDNELAFCYTSLSSPLECTVGSLSVQSIVVSVFNAVSNLAMSWCCFDLGNKILLSAVNQDVLWNIPNSDLLLTQHNSASLLNRILQLPINQETTEQTKMTNPNSKKASKPTSPCYSCARTLTLTKVETSSGKKFNLCVDCARTKHCEECDFKEPLYLIRRMTEIHPDSGKNKKIYICNRCANENEKCDACGDYFNGDEYAVCPCRMRNDFKDYIKAHNEDVLNFYPMDMYSNELFGIEIEVGTLNRNRPSFPEIAKSTNGLIANDAILKYDSSIDYINKSEGVENNFKGFEVVTRPMVFKNSMRFLREFCKNKHPLLKSWEVGTCGLHIHVSKACLRPFEIGKILLFVNDKRNRKFIKMIAKREDKRFAKFIPKCILDYKNSHPNCHYEAINTSKEHTIEFRVFRGTLNIQTVLSYLQFVKSVIDFVRVTSKDNLLYKNYIEYLYSTEKSQFRELKQRIDTENQKEIKDRGEI